MQHPDGIARRRWIGALGIALTAVAIAAYYVFVCTAGRFDQWADEHDDHFFYDSQAQGFRARHLYTSNPPNPELLSRDDPYDPRNRDVWSWDYSLYGEHLYLYWGLAPALLLAAVKSLLRVESPVSDSALVLTFLIGRGLAGAGLIRLLARQFMPSPPRWSVWLAWLVFALAHPTPFLLARPTVYEGALSAGSCFLTAALWAGCSWLFSEGARSWRLAAASLCLALAGTSRASLLPTGAALLVLLLISGFWRVSSIQWPPRFGRSELRWLVAASLPFGVLVSVHLLVNQLRFGSWTEFGANYQLGIPFEMGVRFVPANLWHYLFHTPSWHCDFPFLIPRWAQKLPSNHDLPSWLPAPDGYRAVEPVVGVLSAVPFLWLIAVALLRRGIGSRPNTGSPRWRAVWILLISPTVTSAPPVLMLFSVSMRYEAEFMSPLLLLAALGGWSLFSGGGRIARGLARTLYVALAAFSVLIGVSYGFTGYFDTFESLNPGLFKSLQQHLDLCSRARPPAG